MVVARTGDLPQRIGKLGSEDNDIVYGIVHEIAVGWEEDLDCRANGSEENRLFDVGCLLTPFKPSKSGR